MRKLGIVLGMLAFVVFGVLPLAINMITGDYPLSAAIAMIFAGLITNLLPVILILGAIPTVTAVIASSKREKRLEIERKENDDENI